MRRQVLRTSFDFIQIFLYLSLFVFKVPTYFFWKGHWEKKTFEVLDMCCKTRTLIERAFVISLIINPIHVCLLDTKTIPLQSDIIHCLVRYLIDLQWLYYEFIFVFAINNPSDFGKSWFPPRDSSQITWYSISGFKIPSIKFKSQNKSWKWTCM